MLLTTKDEADLVIAASKFILVHIVWRPMGVFYKLDSRVGIENTPGFLVGRNYELRIIGNKGKRTHGFSLLLNDLVLRRYDCCGPHTNPDGSPASRPHKHYWTPEHDDRWTYFPRDIDPASTINDQFFAFLAECNIELRGSYQPLLAGD